MANEIERKFLVDKAQWNPSVQGTLYRQGYLSSVNERVVRVRIAGEKAFLTVKGITQGVSRLEFEYEIPVDDAGTMLDRLCERPLIEKTRYVQSFNGHAWEVDDFHGDNQGLIIAEIELSSPNQPFTKPPWVSEEVSGDPRYFNTNLALHPFKTWPQAKP